jgi:peptide/nickel transport system permease protein
LTAAPQARVLEVEHLRVEFAQRRGTLVAVNDISFHIATAIITEATLSFLGVGVPPTQPSLGTLVRIGNNYLLSGEWWIALFPGLALVVLVLAVNLLGDWLRDALNPKLR